LKIRYRFLPYIYTLFYEAHIKGSTVVRPLFHEFPRDRRALTIDTQFLLGSAFLVSPILEEDAISREIYLPDELWYDFHSYKFEQLTGTDITVVPLDNFTIPLHLRGGCIFPVQEYFGNNTQHTRQQPLGLVITVGRERTAFGS
jgi:alpha-glucosidase (family GH31 glycosyl hydrolase)